MKTPMRLEAKDALKITRLRTAITVAELQLELSRSSLNAAIAKLAMEYGIRSDDISHLDDEGFLHFKTSEPVEPSE